MDVRLFVQFITYANSIMFLSLERFLEHFPDKQLTREQFIEQFTIMYSEPITFKNLFNQDNVPNSVIKTMDDPRWINREQIISFFYEIVIEKRHVYLSKFFQSFFDFKPPNQLKWDNIDIRLPDRGASAPDQEGPRLSFQKNDASRVIIRNLFYKEILHETRVTNSVNNTTSFWQTLDNLYNHLKLEARYFAPSSIGLFLKPKIRKTLPNEINYNNLFYLIQSYQSKASVVNSYTINWIFRNLFPPDTSSILTPVLSWASYLMAMMHLPNTHRYLGIDVIPEVCQKTKFLAEYYQKTLNIKPDAQIDILCSPSELLARDPNFMNQYREQFTAAIICPPYFDMELYPGPNQSTETFPTYQEWLEGYWRPTVRLINNCLQPGRQLAVIINDYYDLNKKFYPLTTDLDRITQSEGFEQVGFYLLQNRKSPLRRVTKERTEKLYIYKRVQFYDLGPIYRKNKSRQ